MKEIVISPCKTFDLSIEAENISPSRVAPLSLNEIENLEVWEGNRKSRLCELFSVSGDDGAAEPEMVHIKLKGDFSKVKRIGEGMRAGQISINGDSGMRTGEGMRGGSINIEGDADSWLGREMHDGSIIVKGNAGDYAGSRYWGERCGMRGGVITIQGSAGAHLGDHMCGGKIVVEGDVGDFPGASNRGGNIIIEGDTYLPGAEMASGTITIKGKARVLPSYQFQETATIEEEEYQKFVGDLVTNGKGELYVVIVERD